MDRQLTSPLLIQSLRPPKAVSADYTYTTLSGFLGTLEGSPARTQLERLTDSLGVETGHLERSELDRREAVRVQEKHALREARRKRKEERRLEREREEAEGVEGAVEGLMDDEDEGQMESGAVGAEGEEGMEDRGDVEYGDNLQSEDEDEPDNEHLDEKGMDEDE